jgi:hypothetical protein
VDVAERVVVAATTLPDGSTTRVRVLNRTHARVLLAVARSPFNARVELTPGEPAEVTLVPSRGEVVLLSLGYSQPPGEGYPIGVGGGAGNGSLGPLGMLGGALGAGRWVLDALNTHVLLSVPADAPPAGAPRPTGG